MKPETISAVANVGLALIGLVALMIAGRQLTASNKSVQNNLIYTLQKDAREMGGKFADGKASVEDILASMQSVYIQKDLGTIPWSAP